MENNTQQYIPGGSFLLARKAFESDLWRNRPVGWWKIWEYIIGNVQHEDYKELKRGQGYFNFRELIRLKAFGQGITYPMVDHFLRYAKSANMMVTQKATHGVVITVCNYNLFQTLDNYKSDGKSDKVSEVKAKQKRNESDNINKNDNNEKNIYTEKIENQTLGQSDTLGYDGYLGNPSVTGTGSDNTKISAAVFQSSAKTKENINSDLLDFMSHWTKVTGQPVKIINNRRLELFSKILQDFSLEDLKISITNAWEVPFNRSEAPNSTGWKVNFDYFLEHPDYFEKYVPTLPPEISMTSLNPSINVIQDQARRLEESITRKRKENQE